MVKIELDSLRKEYTTPDNEQFLAVDNIDLTIESTEFFTLVGPSGCGKTTTLRCIAGLEKPTDGRILFNGEDVVDLPANKRDLAMMFQNIALYPHMKIKDNIAYPLKVRHVPEEERYEQAREAAEVMQISDLLEKYPGELSGGQRQRAALARTIVQEPVAFLMDEPLSDLDAKLKVEMRKEIQRIHKKVDKSAVYVTHDQEEAMTMSDRVAVMNDGQVEQVGTPEELYHRPKNRFVAEFIGMPTMNFLEARVAELGESGGILIFNDIEYHFDAEFVRSQTIGDHVTVGFRPEDVTLEDGDGKKGLQGRISLLERIGDRILATVETPDGVIQATISDAHQFREDQEISISIDESGLFLFNPDTELLLAKGSGES